MEDQFKIYIERIKDFIKKSKDPLVKEEPDLFLARIEEQALSNWLEHGEPDLTMEQLNQIRQDIWDSLEKVDINTPVLRWKSKTLDEDVLLFMN